MISQLAVQITIVLSSEVFSKRRQHILPLARIDFLSTWHHQLGNPLSTEYPIRKGRRIQVKRHKFSAIIKSAIAIISSECITRGKRTSTVTLHCLMLLGTQSANS